MIFLVRLLLLVGALAVSAWAQAVTATLNPVNFTLNAGTTGLSAQNVTLTNPDALTTYSLSANQPWISFTPSTGTITAGGTTSVSIRVDPAGKEAGSYGGTVTVTAPGRPNTIIAVNMTLQGGIITPTPTSFSLSLTSLQTATQNVGIQFTGAGTMLISPASSGDWLGVTKTQTSTFPDSVTLQINPAALSPGLHTGTVTFSMLSGMPALPKTVTVKLTVTAGTDLTVSTNPSPVSYTDTAGSTTAKTATVTVSNTGPAVTYSLSKTQSWIWFSKSNGPLPTDGSDTFTITVSPTGLGAGIYTDTVSVIATGRPTRTIQVRLTLNPPPDINVTPTSLSFVADAGSVGQTAPQTLTVLASGSGANYTVTRSQPWIVLEKTSGSVPTNGSDTFTVSANPANLAANPDPLQPYSGTVTVAAPGRTTRIIPVTFLVNGGSISAAPNLIAFTVAQGSTASQNLAISFSQTTPAIVSIQPNSSGGWLSVNKSSTSVFPDIVSVTVDATSLQPGAYAGSVLLTAAPGSPTPAGAYLVPVQLIVVTPSSLTADVAELAFFATQGSGATPPAAQTVTLTNQGAPVAYAVTSSATWLIPGKTAGLAPGGGRDSFTVRADASGLSLGASTASLTITATGRDTIVIPAAITVSEGSTVTAALSFFPSRMEFYADPGQTAPSQALTVLSRDRPQVPVTVSPTSTGAWLQVASGSLVTPGVAGIQNVSNQAVLPASGEVQLVPASSDTPSDVVPAVLKPWGSPVYSIPRVADGDNFQTSITIVNLDAVPARVSLRFLKAAPDGSTQPWSPLMAGDAPTENVLIPVGTSYTWNTRGLGASGDAGWAQVLCEQKLGGFALFRLTPPGGAPREAAIPMNSGWQQRVLIPFENRSPYVLAVALTNTSTTETASVEAVVRDDGGELHPSGGPGSWSRTLPPLGHAAFTLPSEMPSAVNRRGTVELVTSGGRMSATALRFSGEPFTSIEPQTLNAAATGRLSIPQIADGGGFSTSVTVVNNDTVPARVSLRFARQTSASSTNTQTWNPTLEGNPPPEVTIKVGASYTWRTRGLGTASQGWAEVVSMQRVSGFAVFRQSTEGRPDQEAAVPINAGTPAHFLLPFDNTEFVTTTALANISTTDSATIDITFRDEQARVLRTETLILPPRGHDAFALTRYPQVRGVRGAAEFRIRSGQVSALGLRFSGEAFTSFRPLPY